MNKAIILFKVLLLFLPAVLSAQTIEVQLPFYAGRDFHFSLLQGSRVDTVATGTLNARGKATIDLSRKYASYRGVGRFTVEEYGRVWNIVISGNEKVSMSEPDVEVAEPVFGGSKENSYLVNSLAKQTKLINEFFAAGDSEQPQSYVLASPEQRMQRLENEYKAFQKEVAASQLYAARVLEILNLLTGVGSSFGVSQEEVSREQQDFIVRKVDFKDLYTSGFWQPVFDLWYQLVSMEGQAGDNMLLAGGRNMLDRCSDMSTRRELMQTIIRLFSKYGKDSLLAELGTEFLSMPLDGQVAPEIVAGGKTFQPKNSLIIFHETDCGSCRNELENLKNKYELLTSNGIRVISIAADEDRGTFEEDASKFPWADKICDFKGFEGVNFSNYGIVGTPTYILVDADGIVRGRYVQLKELLKD